jgi:transposase
VDLWTNWRPASRLPWINWERNRIESTSQEGNDGFDVALAALAFVLIIGEVERFPCGKQIAAYLGLVPEEKSSGQSRRLGHMSKQGSGLMRFLLVEAAQVTVRSDGEWRSKYSIWRCGEGARSRTWRWRVDSRFACSGCGASSGIMSS